MGTHTCIVSRAGSNASDTSAAAAFSWQVGAGSGSNPVNATDFPGGTFPSGTGTVAAGVASATITFQSNPDATFEPDETGVLTVTTTQSGVTVTGSPQPFTITNDDANPGGGNTFGPAATSDTGFLSTGSADTVTIMGSLDDTPYEIFLGCDDNNGAIGFVLYRANSNHITGAATDGQGVRGAPLNSSNYIIMPDVTGGIPFTLTYKRSTRILRMVAGNEQYVVFNNQEIFDAAARGPFVRFKTGGAPRPSITITAA